MRFLKSFTNSVGVGLSVRLLIWFVEIMNHKNRATKSFSNSETFSNKSVKVSILGVLFTYFFLAWMEFRLPSSILLLRATHSCGSYLDEKSTEVQNS